MFSRQYHHLIINDCAQALQVVITVLSLVVNSLLLRIVFTCKRREIGAYRYLIATFAVSDLVYTSTHWLVFPIPETYGNAFLLSGHGLFSSRLAICIYCGVYVQSTPILIFHFVYRTLSVRSCICMYTLMRPDAESLTVIAPFFAGNTSAPVIHRIETAPNHIQALYWSGETFTGPRWRNLSGAIDAMVTILLTYIIILVCAYFISKSLTVSGHKTSLRTATLQHQLYRSLVLQAVYPFISTYSPLSFSMFLPICGISFDWMSIVCPSLCVSHPLFDALILIFCLSVYRREFLRMVGLSRFTIDTQECKIVQPGERKLSIRPMSARQPQ